jgi:hypothetical protein
MAWIGPDSMCRCGKLLDPEFQLESFGRSSNF